MPARPSWKGFLRLSLVTVPVKAFSAAAPGNEVRLNQLHADCNARIKHVKTCPEHGAVDNEAIVSGHEYAKGQYVVVDLDELQKLRPERDGTIRVEGFVEAGQVDPIYHAGRIYYLLPDGAVGQKPYALLLRAMVEGGIEALAHVVLTGREHLVLVRPIGRLLAMALLHHESKVQSPATFHEEVAELEVAPQELALTKTLIDATRIKDFDYAKYEDDYTVRLNQLIQAKVDGREIVAVRDPEEPKILNLMDALKRSVAQAQSG